MPNTAVAVAALLLLLLLTLLALSSTAGAAESANDTIDVQAIEDKGSTGPATPPLLTRYTPHFDLPDVPALRPQRILFVCGAGTFSHALPGLEIGQELVKRGHIFEVALLDNFRHWADGYAYHALHSLGSIEDLYLEQKLAQLHGRNPLKHLNLLSHLIDDLYPSMFELLSASFANKRPNFARPDIVLCDVFSVACFDAARHHRVPFIAVHCTPVAAVHADDVASIPEMMGNPGPVSFWDRFKHRVLHPLVFGYALHGASPNRDANRQRLGLPPGHPFFMAESFKGVPLLVNSYWGIDTPTPIAPYVHFAGPLLHSVQRPMDPQSELAAFLNRAALEGAPVVLYAMGSQAVLPQPERLVQAMWQLAHTGVRFVLAERNASSAISALATQAPASFLRQASVPQRSVLTHPAVRAFITHGGASSIMEAVEAAVPMVLLPVFGDQPANAMRMQRFSVGVALDTDSFSSVDAVRAVQCALNPDTGMNPVRSEALRQMQWLLRQQAHRARTRGADFVEEVAVMGWKHRQPESESLSYLERTCLDVYAVVFVLVLALLDVAFVLTKRCLCPPRKIHRKTE